VAPTPPLSYPPTRKSDLIEDYHGTPVADPYRWLEDADSPETKAWTEAQNQITRAYLDRIPTLGKIEERLTALWNYPKYPEIKKKGEKLFFIKNDGLQNQPVLYAQHGLDGEPRVLLDPNTLSEDGTIALMGQFYSKDGKYLACCLASSGSDWQDIHIMEVASGDELEEVIKWTRFPTLAWKTDQSGFFYNRRPEPGDAPTQEQVQYSQVYWHTLGTPQTEDPLVYDDPDDRELNFSPEASDDGAYLLLYTWRGTDRRNGLYFRAMDEAGEFTRLAEDGEAKFLYAGNQGALFYIHTNLEAPRGRVIAVDFENPERDNWVEVIPEGQETISTVKLINGHLVVFCENHAHAQIKVYTLEGEFLREIPLPAMGTATYLDGGDQDTEFYFAFTSFLYPRTIFRYDFENQALTPFHENLLDFDTSEYETNQVFYTSKDGTRVPMFLTHRKGLELNGDNPTILYGYGGFTISLSPFFEVWNLAWIEMGGVFAVANLRGGSEYGEEWHQAALFEKKQNAFDDFIAAAEWLVEHGYTRRERLAIEGRSNGGLLVSACMVQRPELYGAVLCHVPVADMLRYHRFTAGRFWVVEYGNAEENPEHFQFLSAYSPLHNVKEGTGYPPILVTTADTDDRVVPSHAKKLVATLQEKNRGDHPMLLRVETKAGHKLGKPTYKLIEERADVWAFVMDALGMA
jgi:prolyl oligopeptidase